MLVITFVCLQFKNRDKTFTLVPIIVKPQNNYYLTADLVSILLVTSITQSARQFLIPLCVLS